MRDQAPEADGGNGIGNMAPAWEVTKQPRIMP